MVAIPNEMDHVRMFDFMIEGAVKCFTARGGHVPMVFGLKHQAKPIILPVPQLGGDFRPLALNAMRNLAVMGADAVVLVVEAWQLTDVNEEELKEWAGRVSEHPQRKEVLQVTYSAKRCDKVAYAEIIREGDGKPTLGEWKKFGTGENEQVSGRFCNVYEGLFEGK